LYESAQAILRKEKDQKYCIMDGSCILTMPQVMLWQCSNSWQKKRNCTCATANVFARPRTIWLGCAL